MPIPVATESERLSPQAFQLVRLRRSGADPPMDSDETDNPEDTTSVNPIGRFVESEYRAFAKSFPMMIRSCGLAQATAWAATKGEHPEHYLDDLAVMLELTRTTLVQNSRDWPLREELFRTRQALRSADCLKRWAEALLRTRDQIKLDLIRTRQATEEPV